MAAPGAVFEGSYNWRANTTSRKLNWPVLFKAANDYAATALAAHKQFAQTTGLSVLGKTLDELGQRLDIAKERGNACLLSLGWSAGFIGKTGWPKTDEERYRGILGSHPVYERAIRSGMPFPKTRRIVFLGNNPAALPGWVWFEVA
jgi:CRISPR-associated protein Csm5